MRKTFLAVTLITAAACHPALAQNQPAPTAQPATTEVTAEQKAEYFRTLGWNIGANSLAPQFSILDMSETEQAEFVNGLARGIEGKDAGTKEPLAKIAASIDTFFQARAREWEQKNRDFLRQVDKIDGIQQTASGLRYQILEKGKSPIPTRTSSVKAIYTGALHNGRVFDSTAKHGTAFTEFSLTQVIPGWTEGLQKIGKGGKIRLYIPHEIGYGERGTGGIPPYSTLVFDVELIDVMDSPTPPTAAPAQ